MQASSSLFTPLRGTYRRVAYACSIVNSWPVYQNVDNSLDITSPYQLVSFTTVFTP